MIDCLKHYSLIILLLVFSGSKAQNLVPNPSFEEYNSCPQVFGQISFCKYWYDAHTVCSVDYFNRCSSGWNVGVPLNGGFYVYQEAATGDAYIGLFCSQLDAGNNIREYVGVKLLETLRRKRYYVNFKINLIEKSKNAISTIGCFFSDTNRYVESGYMIIAEPQVMNDTTQVLDDTLNWMTVSGSFMANGDEKYMVIGNFRDDYSSHLVTTNTFNTIARDAAYYLIDDVCVSANPADCGIDTTGMFLSVEGVDKEPINIYPNPTQDKLYIQSEAHLLSYYTIADIAG